MSTPLEKIESIRAAIPAGGLFAEKEWLLSPEPFALDAETVAEFEKLGHRLSVFVRACNDLYNLSATGRQPAWIADYLDRGKPRELVDHARDKKFREDVPRVIRPDIVLTDGGFTITELDSVPGGIGLTAWLNQTYASLGADVIGGANGMIEGFRSILPGGDILVSREAATYKPEMEWMAERLNAEGRMKNEQDAVRVLDAESYTVSNSESQTAKSLYRFFELFDLHNIPAAPALMEAALRGHIRITPPLKPFIEEKMWLALFWMRPLREYWRRALRENHFLALQKTIPYSWIMDPAPLPQHAVIPRLEINDWRELGAFSQKQRALILKISGFSELAWGSRAVFLGQDMPHAEWSAVIDRALAGFDSHPYVLQEFHKGRIVEHPYLDPTTGVIRTMQGRVRLCPYYFVTGNDVRLGGILATVCPAEKKLLHGMKDAIMVPCAVANPSK